MLYDLCRPKLYQDCLVGDLQTFVQDLDTNPRKVESLSQTTTLRLYHPFQNAYREPSYQNIFSESLSEPLWPYCGMKICAYDPLAGYRSGGFMAPVSDIVWLKTANDILLQTAADKPDFMARIARVIMTGVGDDAYGASKSLLSGEFGVSLVAKTII
jgi:hypothetical protein